MKVFRNTGVAVTAVLCCLGVASGAQMESGNDDRTRREAEELTSRAIAVIEDDEKSPDGEKLLSTRDDFRRAATLWEGLGDRAQQGRCLHGLAYTSVLLDDHETAAAAAIAASEIAEELGDSKLLSLSLGELAIARLKQGRNPEAEEVFLRAAELADELGDDRHRHTMLHNLASSYTVRKSYQDALDTHREALELARRAELDAKELSSLISIASIHAALGDPERASRRLAEAVELAAERGDRRRQAWALRELGEAQVKLELFDQARLSYERSFTIRRELGNRRGAAMVVNQLASLEKKLGNLDRAYELFLEANTIAAELDDHVGAAVTRANAARVLLQSGRPKEAHAMMAETLASLENLGLRRLQIPTLNNMASASLELDQPERARNEALTALSMIETVRGELADPDLRARYLAPRREVFVSLAEALILLDRKDPESGYLEAAFAASERAHARTLLELVKASSESADHRTGDAELASRREAVVIELSEVQGKLLASSLAAERRTELETRRTQLDDERRELDGALRRRAATAEEPTPDLTRLQNQLGNDTALVEYLVGKRSTVLLVVTNQGVTAHLLGGKDVIRSEVEALRELMMRPGRRDRARLDRAAASVGEMLLGPAVSRIARRERLVVVPDGALHLLPFEAISTDGGETRVVDHWSITYAPSATFLQTVGGLRVPGTSGRSLFAVADPVLGDPGGNVGETHEVARNDETRQLADGRGVEDLRPLPGARAEVAEIAKGFSADRRTILIGETAREDVVLAHPMFTNASHLHFATHALASSDLPEHSGLVLGSSGTSDGLLQAFEIFDLSLDAEMVVLSGCETALGPELSGEGLIGLTRAFLYAGADSVVMSLWPVEDQSTRELMDSFYRLLADTDPAAALRGAKLELADTPGFDHPFHWAPFVLVGVTWEDPKINQMATGTSESH